MMTACTKAVLVVCAMMVQCVSSLAPIDPSMASSPRRFAKEVILPWSQLKTAYFPEAWESHKRAHPPCDFTDRASLRFETELGIPKTLTDVWFSYLTNPVNNEDGGMFLSETGIAEEWAADGSVCIEGGEFDWKSTYCQLVENRIIEIKEEVLTVARANGYPLPTEISGINRYELLNTHEYNELFVQSLARNETQHAKIQACFFGSLPVWFVPIADIRIGHYFPSMLIMNAQRKGYRRVLLTREASDSTRHALYNIFDAVASTTRYTFGDVQKHLVQNLNAWRSHMDLIPALYDSIALPLHSRDNKFTTPGAMAMHPLTLLDREPVSMLAATYDGLEEDRLEDTPRVKVLRSDNDVRAAESALNIPHSFLQHSYYLAGVRWAIGKTVAVMLLDEAGNGVALAVFMFNGRRGRDIASLGGRSTVNICMKNESPYSVPKSLLDLCKHYHNDVLYGWRTEILEEDNPEWYQRQQK